MKNGTMPHMVEWRQLICGAHVWAPYGTFGWREGIVTGFGRNRGEHTLVTITFESGGKGKRYARVLAWRKPELKGRDKPMPPYRFGGFATVTALNVH